MIELPDDEWAPYVTVVGVGELGVRVLLKLYEKKQESLKLCAIVSDKTQIAGKENQFSAFFVGDGEAPEQQSGLHRMIQNSIMFLVVADTADAFSERLVSAITAAEKTYESCSCYFNRYEKRQQNIVSFALLLTSNDNEGQDDYIHQTRAIYMTPQALRRQCAIQPELFADEVGVIAEMAAGFANMLLLNNGMGLDVADIQFECSRPRKMTISVGQGYHLEDAVEKLLLSAAANDVDFRQCEVVIFSLSAARNNLSPYDVGASLKLMAKKMGREPVSLSGDSALLISVPFDDSLGDKLKIFAVFCEGKK